MNHWLLDAWIAGVALAAACGPLGAFVVWRRMAYFGDTLAHSALLGISLALFLDIHPALAITIAGLALAIALVGLQHRQTVATDTLLGILAHTSLAAGLVILSFFDNPRVDLMAYLFGDLLALDRTDVMLVLAGTASVIAIISGLWRPLLAMTIHEELARAEGLPTTGLKLALMAMIALVVALAMKMVGILLITALLVIPAATARGFSRSPGQMAILAAAAGILSVSAGLAASLPLDTPAGPTIVTMAGLLYLLSLAKPAQ
ncbi:MAG: zinc ABC transporter permease subunit ZnuB [Gammaproteobacteria bacterium]|nr:MAG: zinc ABC transporter permease subunit ZnuB [Gammaproteobacteria bacterium]